MPVPLPFSATIRRFGQASALALWVLSAAGCSSDEEGSCSLVENANGTWTMSCPDGTSGTFFPAPNDRERGDIRGVARRLGVEDGSGISVGLYPTAAGSAVRTTFTDEEGAYQFLDVEPGIYHLAFRFPAYTEEVRRQRPVLPGVLELEDVTLRPTSKIYGQAAQSIIPAPSEDAFVFRPKKGEALLLWEEGASSPTLLTEKGGDATWLSDGSEVLYIDGAKQGQGALRRYERGSGKVTTIASEVVGWWLTEDEEGIVVRRSQNRLSVWHEGSLREVLGSGLVASSLSPKGNTLVAIGQARGASKANVLIWDIPSGNGSVLGTAEGLEVKFDERGRSFIFHGQAGPTLWEAREQRIIPFPAYREADLRADGEQVLLHRGPHPLAVYDVKRRFTQVVSETFVEQWTFDPRTGDLYFVSHDPAPTLKVFRDGVVATLEGPDSDPENDLRWVELPWFPEGFTGIVYAAEWETADGIEVRLKLWEPGTEIRTIEQSVQGGVFFSQDGTLLFYERDGVHVFDLLGKKTSLVSREATLLALANGNGGRLVHFPMKPLYRNLLPVGHTMAPIGIYDIESEALTTVADEIWHQRCEFSPAGTLFCLSRRSPVMPWGSYLLRWDDGDSRFHWLSDGVLSFSFSPSGKRTVFLSQPRTGTASPLLWLHQENGSGPLPIDDGVELFHLSERWLAYSIPDGSREGVYVSMYPFPPKQGDSEK